MKKIKLLLLVVLSFTLLTNCNAQNYEKLLSDDKVHVRNNIFPKGHFGDYSSSTVSKNNLHSSFSVDSLYRLNSFSLRDSLTQIRGEIEYKTPKIYIMYLSIIDEEKSKDFKTWSVSSNGIKVIKGLVKGEQFLGKWVQYSEETKEEEGSILFVDKMGKGITNAVSEGLNSVMQIAKSRARGYRNINNFATMIYFLGNPDFHNF